MTEGKIRFIKNKTVSVKLMIFFEMLLLKIMYMEAVNLMLPDRYIIWSFEKSIDFFYGIIELIPFVLCFCAYIRNYKRGSIYSFFSTLLFVIFYIPVNSGLSLSKNDLFYYIQINTYAIVTFALLGLLSFKEERDICIDRYDSAYLYEDKKRTRLVRILMIIVCTVSIGYVYSYNGLDFSKLQSDMYSTRGEFAAYISENTDSLLSYFLLLFRKMTEWLLPICLYFSLLKKSFFDITLCIFALLALFTMSMEKSTLMIIGVVFFTYSVEKKNKFNLVSELLIKAFVIVFVICFAEYCIYGESMLFSMIVRRMLYMPSWLTKVYYDFYSHNPKMWFTQDVFFVQNITQRIFGRMYRVNSTGVISNAFFSGLIPSPNTGMFAEAYGQLGALGIFVFPFILTSVIRTIRKTVDWFGNGVTVIVMTKLCLKCNGVSILASSEMVGFIFIIIITCILKYFYHCNRTNV